MPLKLTKIYKKTLISFVTILGLSSAYVSAYATTADDTRSSRSISFSTDAAPNKTEKDSRLEQIEKDTMPALIKQGFREESTNEKSLPAGIHVDNTSYHNGEFSIYNASTELVSDFDHDGFYHRFSVAIDADTIHATSYVYAKLYLSYEGGPWNHYATSNNYHIYGDSAADTFVIETELADGFPTGYYDVRIELYDADHNDWLLSYGPYDDSSLSNLTLEDSYYDDEYVDDYYIETTVAVGAGSLSWWLLIIPLVLALTRLVSTNRK